MKITLRLNSHDNASMVVSVIFNEDEDCLADFTACQFMYQRDGKTTAEEFDHLRVFAISTTSEIAPFQNHMHLACSAMSFVFEEFERLSNSNLIEGFYPEVFKQDEEASHDDLVWDYAS
jgi:hypothetical protein